VYYRNPRVAADRQHSVVAVSFSRSAGNTHNTGCLPPGPSSTWLNVVLTWRLSEDGSSTRPGTQLWRGSASSVT